MWGSLLLGVFGGLVVALTAMGVVLIFKTGRYVNFAQAQLGIVPMLVLGKLVLEWHVDWWLAVLLALALGAVLGVAANLLVIRPLSKLGPQVVLVATIGISQVLVALADVSSLGAPPLEVIARGYPVPFRVGFTVQSATFFAQHVLTVAVAAAVALALYVFLTRSLTGKSIRALACNEEAGRLAGLDVGRLSTVAWAIAGVLAAVAAILAAPSSPSFDPGQFGPGLMLRALGAAALAGFGSFPQAVAASVLLGAVEQATIHYSSNTGTGTLAVFVTIVVGLLLRRPPGLAGLGFDLGRGSALRPGIPPRARVTLAGRAARVGLPLALLGLAFGLLLGPASTYSGLFRVETLIPICGAAASVSLLAGVSGQLSLGQAAFVGLGAQAAGRLVTHGWTSFPWIVLGSGLVAAAAAVAVALPALRGGSLSGAVTSLGFGVLASSWLFLQRWFPGHDVRGPVSLWGLGPLGDARATYVVLVATLALLLGLASLALRSRLGSRMLAVRFNELGARALGIGPTGVTMLGVALAGFLAGGTGVLGGVVRSVPSSPDTSLLLLSIAVVGGLGSVTGAVVAALLVFGVPLALESQIGALGLDLTQFQYLLGGLALVANLAASPGGLAAIGGQLVELVARRGGPPRARPVRVEPEPRPAPRGGRLLRAERVSVSFGPVQALREVSLEVGPGEIVGLIGNNGAGKTTLLDCLSGTLRPDAGRIELFGVDVTHHRVVGRARHRLGRTFQDAGLFAGLTTEEVVMLAARRPVGSGARRPARARARAVLADFCLEPYAATLTADLPTGVRRTVELAVQVARRPRLVLLDEPAAGLSQAEVHEFGPLLRRTVERIGSSVLMIEHDLPLMLSLADRIYCLELGVVIAEGTPTETRENPRVIESYFGSPAGVGARRSGIGVLPG